MARLDDIPTLPTNLELSGKDSFVVADKSFRGGTFAKQIPAAIIAKYSHAFLINFNSASFAVASASANITLKTFSDPVIISEAAIITTKPFTGLGGSADASFIDSSGSPIHFVRSVPIMSVGAEIMNTTPSGATVEPAETLLIPADGSIKAKFSGDGVNLDQATAGQAIFLVNIIDVNDYIDFIPPFD